MKETYTQIELEEAIKASRRAALEAALVACKSQREFDSDMGVQEGIDACEAAIRGLITKEA